jgi:hypothetical protein
MAASSRSGPHQAGQRLQPPTLERTCGAVAVDGHPHAPRARFGVDRGPQLRGRSKFTVSEDERQRIVKRANDGRAAARKRGVHMGRKPKLTELQRRIARERVAKGESARAIAQEWGVAHTTVARAVA